MAKTASPPSPLTLERLSAIAVPILRKHGVKSAAVFGSVAQGNAAPGSDVDLLVEYEKGVDLFDLARMREELKGVLGCHVDLVSRRYIRPRMRESIVSQAVPIYVSALPAWLTTNSA